MNVSKLIEVTRRSCRNLLLPEGKAVDSRQVLNACWPDVDSRCYVERPSDWMDTSVDISVILPTYNDAAHICRGVESIRSQETEYSFEIIIINDGSTDNTAALLNPYEGVPGITVLHQENRGHSGARNAGLERCRGRYILFHDSDDTLLPGAIQNLVSCAEANDADVVAGGYLEESPEGVRTPGLRYTPGKAEPHIISGMTCGKLYRRKVFESLQFPLGYWYEDSIIAQIILPKADNCWCIQPEVFAYQQNALGVSATSVGHPKSVDSLYVTAALLRDKEAFGLPLDMEAYNHFLYMVLLTYHRTSALDGDVLRAIFRQQQALRNQYFPDLRTGSAVEKALLSGSFRRYIRACELGWLKLRLAG